ncbi:helix-turn-helix transcriptional regulator [Candidatus Bathyarchaeota archaeon]|nr:helix-turn-helix transcriptional regulator [Candidatus Bathyarchaeota archaeon]
MKNVLPNDIEAEIERRLITSFMDLIILRILRSNKQGTGGYDITRYLQLKHNILPSSGTVYSCLYAMERRGLIKGRENGRKRVYILTQRGERVIKALEAAKNKLNRFTSMILYGTGR